MTAQALGWHWAKIAPRPLPRLARQPWSTEAGSAYSLQRVLGAASRCSPPCAKGGQHGRAMQGGIDSTQLPGRYQVPGVGMVSQVPSIPQSAFADSSLCTREVRWPDGPSAWAVISLLAVLHPTGPFCGTLPGLHPGPFRGWLASAGAGKPAAHDAGDRNGSGGSPPEALR